MPDKALLTDLEHEALKVSGHLVELLHAIAGTDPMTRDPDLARLDGHIFTVQAFILAQAGARAHPTLYRLIGGPIVNPGMYRHHEPETTTP